MSLPDTKSAIRGLILVTALAIIGTSGTARGEEVFRDGDRSLSLGFWTQAWYQYVQDGTDRDGDGELDRDVHDFLVRRAYLSVKGTATPSCSDIGSAYDTAGMAV